LLKDIIIAIDSYFKAHRFIQKHNLWKWILVPGLIYAILFMVSMYFFGKSATGAIEFLSLKTGLKTWVEKMQSGWMGFLFTLGGVILWLILMMFYFSLFKFIFLIIGSPVFAYLSEKTESILEGKDFPFSFSQLLKDIIRGIRVAVRNSLWQTVYVVSIILLSLIPVIGWGTPVLALLVECYYYGFSMLDYSCERMKMSPQQSYHFINNHKGLAIGNGGVFYVMHALILVGWVLAPAYAVVAATLSMRQVKPLST
jgi:CysZ protein